MLQWTQAHKHLIFSFLVVSLFLINNCSKPGNSQEGLLLALLSSSSNPGTSPTLITPEFSPPAKPYSILPANVSISADPIDATICYTANGSTPACNQDKDGCASGSPYLTPVSPITHNLTLKAIACKSGMNDSAVTSGTYTLDTTLPTLDSSTPTNAATGVAVCSGNPCTAKIVLRFSESMQTTTPTLTTEVESATGTWVLTPNTGTTFGWSQTSVANDTLTINMSWYWFPENSNIRYKIAAADLKDVANNQIAAQVQQTFKTTWAGRNFTIADTGQTTCSSGASGDGAMAACPQTITGQDGDFANTPNPRSFTGPTLYGASDYTTKDNTTGLVWKTCTEGLSGATCATGTASTMAWETAVSQCATLNSANSRAGYAGIKTWRLPTSAELETIVDYGKYNPAIDASVFPATVASNYWSSTTFVGNTANAWYVSFYTGAGDGHISGKTLSFYVRCVSSGP